MHGFIKLAAAMAISGVGLLHPIESVSQEIFGPTSVTAGQTESYSVYDDFIYQTPNFILIGTGTITSQTHSGTDHAVTVHWDAEGSCVLRFRNGTIVLATLEVDVAPCPSVAAPSSATATPATFCGSGTTAWSATGAGAGESYAWYTAASGGTAITPATAISVTTTYWVGKKITATGCEGPRISVTATVNPLPVAPLTATATPATFCGSGTTAWAATGAGAGETYVWYTASSGGSPVTPTTAISATTTYYVAKKITATTCEGPRIPVTATVNPLPVAPATATATPSTFCGSGTTAWAATGAGAGETYAWYTTASGGTAITPTTAISATTTYYVGKKITATGCEGPRISVTATVNPLPVAPATATATPATFCGSGTTAWAATGAGAGETYAWYTAASGGTAITPTTAISATTTYYVAKKITATTCEGPRIPVTATVNPLPVAPATATATPATFCGSGTTAWAATGAGAGETYAWYIAASGGSPVTPTTTISATTTYYVAKKITATTCEGPRLAVTATVNPLPVAPATATATPSTLCGSGTTAWAATGASGSESYVWYTVATGGSAVTPTTAISATTTYYVGKKNNTTACEGPRLAVTATVNSLPVAPLTATATPSTFCGSGTTAWAATGASGSESYVWYTVATGGSAITPTTAISATTTYYVGKKNNTTTCEGPRLAVTATVNPLPVAPLTATATPSTFCGSGTTAWAATGASGSESYVWYTAATGGSAITPTTAISATTTYYVGKKNNTTTCEGPRLAVTATVNTLPVAPLTATATPATLCAGSSTTLSATGASGSESYVWYTVSSGGTSISATQTPSATTTYYVGKKNNTTTCEGPRLAVTATVNTLPVAPLTATATPSTFCGSGTTAWAATGASGSESYVWYTAATGGSAITPTTAISATTTYYVAKKNNTTTCEGPRLAVTATVNTLPVAPLTATATPSTFCGSGTTAWAATGASGSESYVWYTAATGGSAITPTTAISATTTYYVGKKNNTTTCEGPRLAVTATVNTLPVAPLTATATPSTFCGSGTTAWAATGASGSESYVWYTAATGGSAITPTTAISATTTYYVGKKNNTTTCEGPRLAVTATVNTLPVAPLTATATPSTFCGSGTTAWAATGASGSESYVWYTAATGGSAITPTTAISATTTYYVGKKNNTTTCEGPRLAVTATVNTLPVAPLTATATPSTFCGSGTTAWAATGASGSESYVWYTAATGGSAITPTTAISATTTYYVAKKNNTTTCEGPRLAVTATVNTLPVAPLTATATPSTFCGSGTTAWAATGASGSESYVWYTAATGGSAITPTTAISATTTYYVGKKNNTTTCEGPRLAVTATVNTLPVAPLTATATPSTFCGSGTTAWAATGASGSESYVWYTAATGGSAITPTTAINATTTYYVGKKNNTTTCEGPRLAVTATVNTLPVAPLTATATPSTFCGSGTTAWAATGASGSESYVWYTAATGGSAITPTTAISATTTYYVGKKNNTTTCEGPRLAVTATVNPLPVAPLTATATPGTLCPGSSTTLSATGASGSESYVWYDVSSGGTSISSSQTPSATTTYYVAKKNNTTTCEGPRLAVTATVNPLPVAPLTATATPSTFCGSGTTAWAATGASGSESYVWYTAATGGSAITPTTAISATTTYYVGKKNNTTTCEGPRLAVTATVNPLPAAPGSALTYAPTCSGVDITRVSSPGAGVTWYWQTTSTGTSTSNSTATYSYGSGAAGGTVYLRTRNNTTSCWSSGATATAVIPGTATPTPGAVCQNGTVDLSAIAGANGTSVRWYSACSGGTALATGTSWTTPSLFSTTTYYVATYNSTTSTESQRVAIVATVNPQPMTYIVYGGGSYCASGTGMTVLLYDSQQGVNYQLKKDGVNEEPAKPGVGGPLEWTNKTVGTYTIEATNSNGTCPMPMSGSPVEITSDLVTVGGTVSGGTTTCGPASGAVALSGHTGEVMRWEFNNGEGWQYMGPGPDTTQNYYDITVPTHIRAVVRNGVCDEVPSDSVQVISVSAGTVDGSITACPTASGDLTLTQTTGTVQRWESSIDGGSSWTNISNTTYSLSYSNVTVTTQYRAFVSPGGACPDDYSTIATINMNPGGTMTGGTTTCGPFSGGIYLLGHSGTVVRWEFSNNDGASWWPMEYTETSIGFSNLVGTWLLRAIVNHSSACDEMPSTSTQIAAYSPGIIDGDTSACTTASGTLTLSQYTGTVQHWESSINGGSTWTQISNTTDSLSYNNVTVTTQYRAFVGVGGGCADGYSSIATITILHPGGIMTGGASTCGPLDVTLTLSGHSGTVVRWEVSLTGATWSPFEYTETSLHISPIRGSYLLRAIVNDSICGEVPSTSAQITGYDPGIVDGDTTLCTTGSGTLTLSQYTGTVQHWESSINGGSTWTQISNTTDSLSYNNVTVTTQYRAFVGVGGGCADGYSSIATITILHPGGIMTGGASTCGPLDVTLTLSGHSGTVVRWEVSLTGATWSPFEYTETSLHISPIRGSYLLRAIVNDSICGEVPSTSAQITGYDPGIVDGDTTLCTTGSGTLTLSQYTGTVQHWESSINGGSTWTQISSTTDSLSYSNVTVTTQYRAFVSVGGGCADGYSSIATITILHHGGIVTGGSSTCGPNDATLTLSGHSGSVVRWEYSSGSGGDWFPFESTDTALYLPGGILGNWLFRAIVNDTTTCGEVPSASAQVIGFGGGYTDGSTSACVTASGTLALLYHTGTVQRWESSIDGGSTWTNIASTNDSLSYSNVTVTTQYRAFVVNVGGGCSDAYSTISTITISNPGGVVTGGTSTCGPNDATLTLSGHSGSVVRWEYSSVSGGDWFPLESTDTTFYLPGLLGSWLIRAIVNDTTTCGEVPSASAQVIGFGGGYTVGNASASVTASGMLALVYHTGTVQHWESSTDGGSTWTNISNTNDSLSYSNVTVTTQYRAFVVNVGGGCPDAYSTIATITITGPGGIVSGSTSACGPLVASLTLSGHLGTVVRWESSSNGGTSWSPIAWTGTTLQIPDLMGTWQFRAIVNAPTYGEIPSASAQVISFGGGVVDGSTSACFMTSGALTLLYYTGTIHHWEFSIDAGNEWTEISNTTNSLSYSNVTVTTQYRAYVVDVGGGACPDSYSTIATITIGEGCRKRSDAPLNASWVNKDAHVLLSQETSKGTSIFLQRSADGISFDDTGAEWSDAEDNNRLAVDIGARTLKIPVLYYRVKFTSRGNDSYSDVATLERNVIGETVLVFPNPANASINIKSIDTEGLVSVSLIDIMGRTVGQRGAEKEIEFDVSTLPAGMYLVTLKYETEGMKAVKVVISH